MKTAEEVLIFKTELKALEEKHGLFVSGCGCCGSPFLEELNDSTKPSHEDIHTKSLSL